MNIQSMLCPNRLAAIRFAVRQCRELDGNAAEFGVYAGNTAIVISQNKKEHQRLYLFDSWQGNLDGACHCSFEVFENNMGKELLIDRLDYTSCEGWFKNTVPWLIKPLAFAHIDCDDYDGTKMVLNHIEPLMVAGGLIIVDDYHKDFPGVMQGVDENWNGDKVIIAGEPHNSVMLYKP